MRVVAQGVAKISEDALEGFVGSLCLKEGVRDPEECIHLPQKNPVVVSRQGAEVKCAIGAFKWPHPSPFLWPWRATSFVICVVHESTSVMNNEPSASHSYLIIAKGRRKPALTLLVNIGRVTTPVGRMEVSGKNFFFLSEIRFTSSPQGVHGALFSKGRSEDGSAAAKHVAELHLMNIHPKAPWME